MKRYNPFLILLIYCAIVTAWSLIRPFDYWVWLFEISVGLIALAILSITYKRFPFSNLIYILVAIHFTILATGGKYTYAEMPLFNWLKEGLHLSRNHFDRVGHFFQGFVPAMVVREFLLRKTELKPGKILFFLCVCVALAISAFWELLEWWIVIFFYPQQGQEWLGMQGDIWDAQKDMLMALCGSILSQLMLSRAHDKSIAKLSTNLNK